MEMWRNYIYLHILIIIVTENRDTPYMVFECMFHGDVAKLHIFTKFDNYLSFPKKKNKKKKIKNSIFLCFSH